MEKERGFDGGMAGFVGSSGTTEYDDKGPLAIASSIWGEPPEPSLVVDTFPVAVVDFVGRRGTMEKERGFDGGMAGFVGSSGTTEYDDKGPLAIASSIRGEPPTSSFLGSVTVCRLPISSRANSVILFSVFNSVSLSQFVCDSGE